MIVGDKKMRQYLILYSLTKNFILVEKKKQHHVSKLATHHLIFGQYQKNDFYDIIRALIHKKPTGYSKLPIWTLIEG